MTLVAFYIEHLSPLSVACTRCLKPLESNSSIDRAKHCSATVLHCVVLCWTVLYFVADDDSKSATHPCGTLLMLRVIARIPSLAQASTGHVQAELITLFVCTGTGLAPVCTLVACILVACTLVAVPIVVSLRALPALRDCAATVEPLLLTPS